MSSSYSIFRYSNLWTRGQYYFTGNSDRNIFSFAFLFLFFPFTWLGCCIWRSSSLWWLDMKFYEKCSKSYSLTQWTLFIAIKPYLTRVWYPPDLIRKRINPTFAGVQHISFSDYSSCWNNTEWLFNDVSDLAFFSLLKHCLYWWHCVWWSAVEGEGKDQMNLVCPNLYAQMAEITRKIGWKVYLNFSWLHWRGYLITQKSHIKIISLLCLERASKKPHQYFMSTCNCEIKWLDKFTSYYVC